MSKVKEFFDDYLNIRKIIESKREYKEMMQRVNALPPDYKYVFEKIQHYMWSFAAGPGYDMMQLQQELLEMFEENAAAGKSVLKVTGPDVGAFANDLLKSVRTYPTDWEQKLNDEVHKKIEGMTHDKS